MPNSYFDIDEILAEEEVVPCATNFTFALLGFLDPEFEHFSYQEQRRLRRGETTGAGGSGEQKPSMQRTTGAVALPSGHRIKMPLWSIDLWSKLSYVRIGLPKYYGGKMRERLVADPSHVNMRTIIRTSSGGETYFLSGMRLVDLVDISHRRVQNETRKYTSRAGARAASSREYKRRQEEAQIMTEVYEEAQFLRGTLLQLYTGERMRRTLDWSLNSGMDDDPSHYTSRLTDTERRLFASVSGAARALKDWKNSSAGGGTALTFRQSMKRVAAPQSINTEKSYAGNNVSMRSVTPDITSSLNGPPRKKIRGS